MIPLVSIHLPKAAGTTLLALYRDIMGADRVLMDYEDDPGNPASAFHLDPDAWLNRRPQKLADGIKVIHGHFHASKYDLLPEAFRLTFMRHPVDNLISIYCYWRKIPPQPSCLHQYFLKEGLDVVGLARLPLLRYLYSKTYFGGWDMGRLDFVGRYENRDADLMRLGAVLGLSFNSALHLNATEADGEASERALFMEDQRLIARLHDILADDIRFYESHVG